ncbi:hypothetical protein [Hymenobacter nivis]|uniref:Uncharacterized protein n=1 Tax=Hymenobacter nivis TaxID=1850093 RepID=A0A2Z3GQD6_9BACT|nr:hypothetical protein [Hymenobacter nivis]AWM34322.1 hypothetical protein DDQ68_16940 [Hymenobacter nivis]
MPTQFLFPHRYKRVGWVLAAGALALGLLEMYDVLHLPHLLAWLPSPIGNGDLPDVVAGRSVRANHDLYAVLLIAGSLLAACSRERQEDEYIGQIRLDSLLWALYTYSALLALAFLLVSGSAFFVVMMYALFTPLLLFMVRFQVALRRGAQAAAHDE